MPAGLYASEQHPSVGKGLRPISGSPLQMGVLQRESPRSERVRRLNYVANPESIGHEMLITDHPHCRDSSSGDDL